MNEINKANLNKIQWDTTFSQVLLTPCIQICLDICLLTDIKKVKFDYLATLLNPKTRLFGR